MQHEEGHECLRTCILSKCQLKNTTLHFKPHFAYVPATVLNTFPHFIYAASSNSQGEPQIPSFPAPRRAGSNVPSASQRIAAAATLARTSAPNKDAEHKAGLFVKLL